MKIHAIVLHSHFDSNLTNRMITGAALADIAIFVMHRWENIQLARGMGVAKFFVAVNKLDVDGWQSDPFLHILRQIEEFLRQQQLKPNCNICKSHPVCPLLATKMIPLRV
jgi:sulfate adenylyltransferase subunit 1 (EFTu-like GTPase family)